MRRHTSSRALTGMMAIAMLFATGSVRSAWAQSSFSSTSSFGPFRHQAQLPVTGVTRLSGDTALVGEGGIVHVFDRDPLTEVWTENASLIPSDSALAFGRAVAIDGPWAIVGAEGAAYIFRRRSDGRWRPFTRLVAADGNPDFGASVDIDANHAIVGAPSRDSSASGAAYVFARHPGGARRWEEAARLTGETRDFGGVLGISGDTAIVGARGLAGHVYFFNRDQGGPGNWGLLKHLLASTGFSSVAIDGDTALIAGAEFGWMCWHNIHRRDIEGPNAWGREPAQRSEPCASQGYVSSEISGDNAIFLLPVPEPYGADSGGVIARNQGTLNTTWFSPPEIGGPNRWGYVSRFSVPPAAPHESTALRLTSASISGDTIAIAVSSRTAPYVGHVEVLVSDVDGDGIRDGRDPCLRDPANDDRCRRDSAQYPVLDESIAQDAVETASDGRRFIITAMFTNTSGLAVKNPFFEVTALTHGNVLINADGGRGRVGSTVSPDVGDGMLSPGESMAVEFIIRLRTQEPFEFRVAFRGEPGL